MSKGKEELKTNIVELVNEIENEKLLLWIYNFIIASKKKWKS